MCWKLFLTVDDDSILALADRGTTAQLIPRRPLLQLRTKSSLLAVQPKIRIC